MTTTAARQTPFTLLVPLDATGRGNGTLYLDDGEQITLDIISLVSYTALPMDYSDDDGHSAGGVIQSTVISSLYESSQTLEKIRIKGISSIKGVFTAIPDTCTASLTWNGDTILLIPELVLYSAYNELVVTVSDLQINIVSDYDLFWKCTTEERQDDDDSKKNSNDDDEGWESIPTYGQALIICAIILVTVGAIFGGYRFYVTHRRHTAETLLPSTTQEKGPRL
jgi:hypothetical protein